MTNLEEAIKDLNNTFSINLVQDEQSDIQAVVKTFIMKNDELTKLIDFKNSKFKKPSDLTLLVNK